MKNPNVGRAESEVEAQVHLMGSAAVVPDDAQAVLIFLNAIENTAYTSDVT